MPGVPVFSVLGFVALVFVFTVGASVFFLVEPCLAIPFFFGPVWSDVSFLCNVFRFSKTLTPIPMS